MAMIPLVNAERFRPVAPTADAFLRSLTGPTAIRFAGRDPSRCRVVVTLLHGNEPSGLFALHQLLRASIEPATDLVVILGSVTAARTEPPFFHRQLPGERDLNRCFHPPFEGVPGKLAQAILNRIRQLQPEAVVDLHNTSGSGPAFGVSVHDSPGHLALVSHFCQRMILTPLNVGALMEVTLDCPVVTVEAGGAQDEGAHHLALAGLRHFATRAELYPVGEQSQTLELLRHPRRLELQPGSAIHFGPGPRDDGALVLEPAIERHNFGTTPGDTALGWCSEAAFDRLRLASPTEDHRLEDYLACRDNQLVTTQALKMFMITTRPDIALSDCLFYFVPVAENQAPPDIAS